MLTILRRVSRTATVRTCTRCGAPLREGLCPNGHPQRAARSGTHRRRLPVLRLGVVVAALAVAVYGALVWYPVRATASLMVPSSSEFEAARSTYESTVSAFPEAADPAALIEGAGAVLQGAERAREAITDAQTRLEARAPVSIPLLDRRAPLPLARDLRDRMLSFYLAGLELVTDMESAARYLTEIAAVLPRLDALRSALGDPRTPNQVDGVLPAARPVADQLIADVEVLSPPLELGPTHEELRAIAGATRGRLEELDRIRGKTARPIIRTMVTEIRAQLDTFGATVLAGPGAAMEAGLAPRIAELQRQIRAITEALALLREQYELDDVVVPGAA
jgi:hypothetical protein